MTYSLVVNVVEPHMGIVRPAQEKYESGAEVQIRATAARWHKFDRWEGDASGITPIIMVTMDSDKVITAYFEELPATPIVRALRLSLFPKGRLTPLYLSQQDYIMMSDQAKATLREVLTDDGYDPDAYEERMKRLWPREFTPKPLTWRAR